FVDGEVSGKLKLFGITLAGVTVGIRFDGFSGRLSARVTVTILFVEKSKTFTIGYLAVPPPVFLASLFNDTNANLISSDPRTNILGRHLWDNDHPSQNGDGTLYLNIGSRADQRSINGIPAVNPYRVDEDE